MNKQICTLYITPRDITVKDGKILIKEGEFYFQGKKYEIKNSEITTDNKVENEIKRDIPF